LKPSFLARKDGFSFHREAGKKEISPEGFPPRVEKSEV
jgi:hypothetical protein